MKRTAVIYWSGTGCTQAMAEAAAEGIRDAGGKADLIPAAEFCAANAGKYDSFAFGCPAMGMESLEETEFEPMFSAVEEKISGKKTVLFGSFGWGDGLWMRNWQARVSADGAMVCGCVICSGMPSVEDLENCRNLGRVLI